MPCWCVEIFNTKKDKNRKRLTASRHVETVRRPIIPEAVTHSHYHRCSYVYLRQRTYDSGKDVHSYIMRTRTVLVDRYLPVTSPVQRS